MFVTITLAVFVDYWTCLAALKFAAKIMVAAVGGACLLGAVRHHFLTLVVVLALWAVEGSKDRHQSSDLKGNHLPF
jgi:hypothetical protein